MPTRFARSQYQASPRSDKLVSQAPRSHPGRSWTAGPHPTPCSRWSTSATSRPLFKPRPKSDAMGCWVCGELPESNRRPRKFLATALRRLLLAALTLTPQRRRPDLTRDERTHLRCSAVLRGIGSRVLREVMGQRRVGRCQLPGRQGQWQRLERMGTRPAGLVRTRRWQSRPATSRGFPDRLASGCGPTRG
jgi:hypothetical protein